MTERWNPLKGKRTCKYLIKRAIEANGGEMPVEELLDHMQQLGYMREQLRERFRFLDVEIVNGKARRVV